MGGPKEGLDCLSLLQTNERILDFLWFNIPLARMGLLQPPSTTCTWFSNLFLMSLMTTQLLVKGLDGMEPTSLRFPAIQKEEATHGGHRGSVV